MFDKMKGMMGQLGLMQRMMGDENFRAFASHPKVQELFKDPAFKEIARSKDFSRIAMYPGFAALLQDPEVAALMAKIDPRSFLGA